MLYLACVLDSGSYSYGFILLAVSPLPKKII